MAWLVLTKGIVANALAAFKMNRWSGAAVTPERLAKLAVLLPLGVLSSGCASAVTGRIQPVHFQFTTIVPHTEPGEGGWRAACVHARITNGDTGDPYVCILGVEMPIENSANGPISTALAQRIAADCANDAAYAVLSAMTNPTPPPLYTLCTSVRKAYGLRLNAAIAGSRVMSTCSPGTTPVAFGIPAPGY